LGISEKFCTFEGKRFLLNFVKTIFAWPSIRIIDFGPQILGIIGKSDVGAFRSQKQLLQGTGKINLMTIISNSKSHAIMVTQIGFKMSNSIIDRNCCDQPLHRRLPIFGPEFKRIDVLKDDNKTTLDQFN